MRYLKKYNENVKEVDFVKLVDDFKSLSNDSLVYLLDEHFTIAIRKSGAGGYASTYGHYVEFSLTIEKTIGNPDEGGRYFSENFTWETIKDDFIPYIEMVNEKFLIIGEFSQPIFVITIDGNYSLSLNDVIKDHVGLVNNTQISRIEFAIKDFKDGSN